MSQKTMTGPCGANPCGPADIEGSAFLACSTEK